MPGLRIFQANHICAECFNNNSLLRYSTSALDYAKALIRDVESVSNQMEVVSSNRKIATILLSKAAIMSCLSGDFVETGVYYGGTVAVMMRVLIEFDRCNRKLYAFDSFLGLPTIEHKDQVGAHVVGTSGAFRISQEVFENNVKKAKAWDDSRIRVVKGWFNETLPAATDLTRISFLRLDGDVYSSTKEALENLYPKVVHGGYIYVDDYGSYNGCRTAVDEFRAEHHIQEPFHVVNETGNPFEAIWWRRKRHED